MRASRRSQHTSGAESMCEDLQQAQDLASSFVQRAITHPHGEPDDIHVHIRAIETPVLRVPSLRVEEVACANPQQARTWMLEALKDVPAAQQTIELLYSVRRMRGAALVEASDARRYEPDAQRGVRASTFGVAASNAGVPDTAPQNDPSKQYHSEALVLASKVASCPHIVAELCISDDPDYTTGYLAMQGTYYRIHNIKAKGSEAGGRVFIFRGSQAAHARAEEIIQFLEHQAVIVE
ncbi:6-carboxyhexanoate--CoA ligase [Corynebacterium gerontici]|uniref:6-carboxyhexanoate--CoA ligase n=2 Tax=Corynebacterium gerontici TaxID=2079234 RepID=A0A3G6J0R5_9CORY|nr:6-carboxyhexanoate--CoA ligase [Corynebacterium gerontici]